MPIELTFSNIAQLIAILTPILIAFFMLMLSAMNQNFKGIVFIAGAILAILINIPLMTSIGSNKFDNESFTCNIIDIPFLTNYNNPSSSSVFIAFTFAYLFMPMVHNNSMNYPIIISLLLLFSLDGTSRVANRCTPVLGVILGGLFGIILGSAWYLVFKIAGANELLYFNEMDSNVIKCDRPSKQSFKCSVYKNGELVSSNIS